jgi:hypothetical protein
MPYSKNQWVDGDKSRPLSAARLNHLETQYDAAMSDVPAVVGAALTEPGPVQDQLNAKIAEAVADVDTAPAQAVAEITGGNVYATNLYTGVRVKLTNGLTITEGPIIIGDAVVFTSTEQGQQWAPVSGGDPRPTTSDFGKLSAWGSSTIAGLATRFTSLAAEYAASYFNGGASAQVSSHILARIGARPALIDAVTIPASGGVTVTTPTIPTSAAAAISYAGTLAGVAGVLSRPSGNGQPLTFTRSASGSEASVEEGTPFIPTHGSRQGVAIVNMGKNGLTAGSGVNESVDFVKQATIDANDWFGAISKPVLIAGHFVDTNTPAESTVRDKITEYNDWARRTYGGRFVDLGGYLTSAQVWNDTGITPTSDDLAQQALGNKPPSLSADDLHLNTAGNNAVIALFEETLTALGWYVHEPDVPVVIAADDFNRADSSTLGTTPTGAKGWDQHGSASAIVSNELSLASLAASTPIDIDAGTTDYAVEAKVAAIGSTASTMGGGILVRLVDSSNFWWLSTRISGSTIGLRFWKQVSGSPTAVGTQTTLTLVPGDVIRVECLGTTLVGYVNGSEVARVTDAHAATGQKVGFFGHTQGLATRWDDFSVETIG